MFKAIKQFLYSKPWPSQLRPTAPSNEPPVRHATERGERLDVWIGGVKTIVRSEDWVGDLCYEQRRVPPPDGYQGTVLVDYHGNEYIHIR